MYPDKKMDHAAYQKRCRKLDDAALEFTIKDAKEAVAANPHNPNNGYYADEICYAAMDLRRRKNG